ncbi:conserved hypothetical protein, partial [Ricinus communis]
MSPLMRRMPWLRSACSMCRSTSSLKSASAPPRRIRSPCSTPSTTSAALRNSVRPRNTGPSCSSAVSVVNSFIVEPGAMLCCGLCDTSTVSPRRTMTPAASGGMFDDCISRATGSGRSAAQAAMALAAISAVTTIWRNSLVEEDIGNRNRGKHAGQVGDQAAGDRVARLADADRAEIQRDDVEGGIGRALEHAGQAADKGIDAIGLHGVDHHGLGGAAAQWLHQCGRQGADEIGVDAEVAEQPAEALHHEAQQAG